jgi:hypothetical protein
MWVDRLSHRPEYPRSGIHNLQALQGDPGSTGPAKNNVKLRNRALSPVTWGRRPRSDDAAKGGSEMADRLTKAEWAQVEESLKSFYSPVGLMCDGYHVMLILTRHDTFKNKIDVYVNGMMSFDYKPETEEIRRFSFPKMFFAHTAKSRSDFKKSNKKRQKWLLEIFPNINTPQALYTPCWGSFKTLKANLIKLNSSIELLKTPYYKAELNHTRVTICELVEPQL